MTNSFPEANSHATGVDLPKSYTPAAAEPAVREKWDTARAFHVDPTSGSEGEPFCILIPPPNVTAALHLGHAFNNTLQDVLTRYHRMRGFKTLWMPGTDHAGIATQAVVERRLMQQGQRRTDFTRDEFVAKVQAWKDEYEATIIEQLKAMGCSCDFERTRFTMDEVCAKAVREAFFRLFKDGLIYRGKRLVNWDPVSQTALADDEVEMEEVQGHMWYLRYPILDEKNSQAGAERSDAPGSSAQYITVATTRPETMLGDTAVAMHPKDPRAAHFVGKKIKLPIVGREIPIIADDYVVRPPQFGGDPSDPKASLSTGFLKVTPAHDPNDEQIWMRHREKIPHGQINIFALDATVSDKHGWTDISDEARAFIGLSREAAQAKVVEWFKAHDLLEAAKPYTHSVGHSYRSHVPIEPYLSDQWYVKVTDDRMRGEALRAMAQDQFEGAQTSRADTSRAHTSRDRKGAEAHDDSKASLLNQCAYFLSFTTYASWLHGDDRGSVDREHNLLGNPTLIGDPEREQKEYESLKQPPMHLDEDYRKAVQAAIIEVCDHRGWRLIALHVRTKHVHCVVIADQMPERVMNDFKSYATRKLRELGLVDQDRRVWTRHGSTRYLNNDSSLNRASAYAIEEQGSALDPAPIDNRAPRPLPYGRGSSGLHHGDGELRFFPARYAKTFQTWHENLRDWCISRQLWWGHRIPVWTIRLSCGEESDAIGVLQSFNEYAMKHGILSDVDAQLVEQDGWTIQICSRNELVDSTIRALKSEVTLWSLSYGSSSQDESIIDDSTFVESIKQDPDVLDTWFSSGLWPISTMGWPDPEAFPNEIPEGSALLNTFNPSTVLLTAREIITLWVSRMVMFNRYFRDGKLPFRNVYVHAMIQDGHGQKMSKSLGNGVDPRDIIHSHGADALRFVMTKLATATQDVRLPVDMICPHCSETFHPKEMTSPAGYKVAAPEQTCPKCNKKMISGYGAASGLAQPSKEVPLARNSSSQFDLGRNFATKLWNVTKFALSNISAKAVASPCHCVEAQTLVDKWIIARLHRTLHAVEDALADYQFNAYADAMYDFIWRDFCDWYIEAIKPTIKTNAAQQQVLRTVLNAALRLLHPIMPFVTETLWQPVAACGLAGMEGVQLPHHDVLAQAPWPDIKCSVEDKSAVATFDRIQSLVEAIRQIRAQNKVNDKQQIRLHAPPQVQELIKQGGVVVEALAKLKPIEPLSAQRPAGAIPLAFEGAELLVSDLVDAVNIDAEKSRLAKLIAEKQRAAAGFRNKLGNEGYVSKAPPDKVEETRALLRQAEADIEAATKALQSLE